jgi:murein DD-endopeptidase MepM/ murein hydrolase activator NlpD
VNAPAAAAVAATAAAAQLVCLGGAANVGATAVTSCAGPTPTAATASNSPTDRPSPGSASPSIVDPPSAATSDTAIAWCGTGAWTQPVLATIVSGFRTAERPDHNGVDLAAARYTPIRAASTGTVIVARCDASTGDCDRDGSPQTPGCGWFVDIQHARGVLTRYCHLVHQPLVAAGQEVTAGQVIGLVGTSGHSSGPHLHFEVHQGGDRSAAGAVDPVAFMQSVGAPLGRRAGGFAIGP